MSIQQISDARAEERIREYAADLAYMVLCGDIDDATANQWMVDLQDRLARDGAWG